MIYDYVSIEKNSIFDYDYAFSEEYSTRHHVTTANQKQFLPLVCVKLFGSADTKGKEGKLVGMSYAERQLHKISIPQKYDGIGTIKLQALNASVKLWDTTIHYRNGRKEMVQLSGIIYQSSESPLIDLREVGGMESITFSLNAVAFSEHPPVLWIWGR